MAKNLFVVNSPLHLMSAFILANSKFVNDDNYLALVHPHGFSISLLLVFKKLYGAATLEDLACST